MGIDQFHTLFSVMVTGLRIKAHDLMLDARLIEQAWELRDIDSLVQLQAIDSKQAAELIRIVVAE
jgi:hypothetical protein